MLVLRLLLTFQDARKMQSHYAKNKIKKKKKSVFVFTVVSLFPEAQPSKSHVH